MVVSYSYLEHRYTTLKPYQATAAAMRAIARGMTFIDAKNITGSIFDESVRPSMEKTRLIDCF